MGGAGPSPLSSDSARSSCSKARFEHLLPHLLHPHLHAPHTSFLTSSTLTPLLIPSPPRSTHLLLILLVHLLSCHHLLMFLLLRLFLCNRWAPWTRWAQTRSSTGRPSSCCPSTWRGGGRRWSCRASSGGTDWPGSCRRSRRRRRSVCVYVCLCVFYRSLTFLPLLSYTRPIRDGRSCVGLTFTLPAPPLLALCSSSSPCLAPPPLL